VNRGGHAGPQWPAQARGGRRPPQKRGGKEREEERRGEERGGSAPPPPTHRGPTGPLAAVSRRRLAGGAQPLTGAPIRRRERLSPAPEKGKRKEKEGKEEEKKMENKKEKK